VTSDDVADINADDEDGDDDDDLHHYNCIGDKSQRWFIMSTYKILNIINHLYIYIYIYIYIFTQSLFLSFYVGIW